MKSICLAMFAASTLALSVCPAFAQSAPPNPMPTGLARVSLGTKQRFDVIKRDIVESAELVPEAEYTFRPTDKVRTFAELVGHVVDGNAYFCALASGENPQWKDTTEKTVKTKAALVQALKDAVAKCDAVYGKTSEANALSLVPSGNRDQMRVMVLLDNVAHLNEHYGNMVTYMRLKGHVPPSTARQGS